MPAAASVGKRRWAVALGLVVISCVALAAILGQPFTSNRQSNAQQGELVVKGTDTHAVTSGDSETSSNETNASIATTSPVVSVSSQMVENPITTAGQSHEGTASPRPSSAEQRLAAMWVLRQGGKVQLADGLFYGESNLPLEVSDVTNVQLDGAAIPGGDLTPLLQAVSLQALSMSGAAGLNDASLAVLRELKDLRRLKITDLKAVTPAGFAFLRELTQLTELDLGGTRIGDEGLAHIAGLAEMRNLSLGTGEQGCAVTDAGMLHLAKLTQLYFLSLENNPIQGTGFQHLSNLTGLRTLLLDQTALTGDGLRLLANFAHLDHLSMNRLKSAGITDDDLRPLENLQSLRYLEIGSSQITDDGLVSLQSLPRLQILNLSHTRVTDAGAFLLKQIKSLKQLDLEGTKVSPSVIQQFKNLQ